MRNQGFRSRWNLLYAVVLGELAITIILFYLFARFFR